MGAGVNIMISIVYIYIYLYIYDIDYGRDTVPDIHLIHFTSLSSFILSLDHCFCSCIYSFLYMKYVL